MNATPAGSTLVPAREVIVGDFVVLPQIGARCVTGVQEGTVGLDQLPCLWITYGLGMSLAWGRSGPVSSPLPEATLRPFRPDELVAIRSRPLAAVRELDDQDRKFAFPLRVDNVDDAKAVARALRDHVAGAEVRPRERDRPESLAVARDEREPEHDADPTP